MNPKQYTTIQIRLSKQHLKQLDALKSELGLKYRADVVRYAVDKFLGV